MSDTTIGDKVYQEKVVQALFEDYSWAEQMFDILDPQFFSQDYLEEIVSRYFGYKAKYNEFPSAEVMMDMICKEEINSVVKNQVTEFFSRTKTTPLNGDTKYIQDTSHDFCRRQSLLEGMNAALSAIDNEDFDSVWNIVTSAANKGVSRDMGHHYMSGFSTRSEKSIRKPVTTPWPVLNGILGGGWERKTLTTFIAPTGAGKSHFLTNVTAGAIADGYNAVYISLELAEFKVGLRHDAYFSGLKINDVADEIKSVEEIVTGQVKGELFIKEFPTKRASVQTIRSYLDRLKTLHNFVPDVIAIDYADLIRSSRNYGEKRHELEGVYEELRGLAQELNAVVVTADQTNRSGLEMEVVTIAQIGEAYAKATVCDLIMTVSRTLEDKKLNTGRVLVAKSRLGADGIVLPFIMNPATVKVSILSQTEETIEEIYKQGEEQQIKNVAKRYSELKGGK